MADLPTYTWDQAYALALWPAQAFKAVGIPPGTVRSWASRGLIEPRGLCRREGPSGQPFKLYRYDEVVRHAERQGWQPRS